jgi:hypothetical protein
LDERLDTSLRHHQEHVDTSNRARKVGDDDDDTAAVAHAHDGLAERFVALGVEV